MLVYPSHEGVCQQDLSGSVSRAGPFCVKDYQIPAITLQFHISMTDWVIFCRLYLTENPLQGNSIHRQQTQRRPCDALSLSSGTGEVSLNHVCAQFIFLNFKTCCLCLLTGLSSFSPPQVKADDRPRENGSAPGLLPLGSFS